MMSSSCNLVVLMGHLGTKPEVFRIGNKPPFAKLTLATNEVWKTDGEKQDRVDWHTVILNRPSHANNAEKYLNKGDKVHIVGKLRCRTWKTREGQMHRAVEVVATELKFLSYKADNRQMPSIEPDDESNLDTYSDEEVSTEYSEYKEDSV